MYKYGIEYEVGLLQNDTFLDFSNTHYSELQKYIDQLPEYEIDLGKLRIGDAGIKKKRWYLEGFERYDQAGRVIDSPSKGIEIRTTPHTSIQDALDELRNSYKIMQSQLESNNITVAHIAYNPFRKPFMPNPPLQPWEKKMRSSPEDQSAYLHMMTYGPDVSLSNSEWSTEQTIQIAKKLVFYSPFISALSVNSPFKEGVLTGNKSERIAYRKGARPAVLCFVPAEQYIIPNIKPTLTTLARLPAEVGRIEFKGLDCVPSLEFYAGVLALIKGIALSSELQETRDTPDNDLLERVGNAGLEDDEIFKTARNIVSIAKKELLEQEAALLAPLEEILSTRTTYADKLIERYTSNQNIIELLTHQNLLKNKS